MKKFIIFITSLTVIIATLVVPASAYNFANSIILHCNVDLLISLDDDSVIISKNADDAVAPASLTKIMTALVVLKNSSNLDEIVTVPQEAIDNLIGSGSSTAGLKGGEQMSVYNLLCCMLIPSGNDAAEAFAYIIGGSVENFVAMMNSTAAELGCKNTHFDNPHGLDTDTHKTTANDLALMAKAALQYPAFETIVASNTYNLPATNMNKERQLVNTNHLLNSSYISYYYKYCKGIKTGSTDNAGRCLVSYASKDGYNYLAVTMGGMYKDTTSDGIPENQAFIDSIKMYKWAFANLSYEPVAKKEQYVTTVPVNYCWSMDSVRLVSQDEVLALIPTGNDFESVNFVPQDIPESLNAPFGKGDYICTAKIMYADQQIGSAKLVVAEDAKLSVLLYAKSILQKMTASTIFKIIIVLIVMLILVYAILFIRSIIIKQKKRELRIVKYNELPKSKSKKRRK